MNAAENYGFSLRKVFLVGSVCAAVAVFSILSVSAKPEPNRSPIEPPLPKLYPVPEFTLTDSSGEDFGLRDLKGHVWIADFIFTSCAGICPIMSTHMAELQQIFADDPRVHFVSISVDPETDTPEKLAEYAARFNGDTARWHLLTGEVEPIHTLATEGFKLGSLDNPINHSDRFVLVDKSGSIRGYYAGTEGENLFALAGDVAMLLRERP